MATTSAMATKKREMTAVYQSISWKKYIPPWGKKEHKKKKQNDGVYAPRKGTLSIKLCLSTQV